jgi:membrane protein involved in colicin uptake
LTTIPFADVSFDFSLQEKQRIKAEKEAEKEAARLKREADKSAKAAKDAIEAEKKAAKKREKEEKKQLEEKKLAAKQAALKSQKNLMSSFFKTSPTPSTIATAGTTSSVAASTSGTPKANKDGSPGVIASELSFSLFRASLFPTNDRASQIRFSCYFERSTRRRFRKGFPPFHDSTWSQSSSYQSIQQERKEDRFGSNR